MRKRMTISPIINSLACPMIGGFFLGVKGGLRGIAGLGILEFGVFRV